MPRRFTHKLQNLSFYLAVINFLCSPELEDITPCRFMLAQNRIDNHNFKLFASKSDTKSDPIFLCMYRRPLAEMCSRPTVSIGIRRRIKWLSVLHSNCASNRTRVNCPEDGQHEKPLINCSWTKSEFVQHSER
jgi:hypothetical protein